MNNSAMEFIDTHCHLQEIGFSSDNPSLTAQKWQKAQITEINDVVSEAYDLGVRKMICVGCDVADSILAVKLAEKTPGVYASVGIHPHEAGVHLKNNQSLISFEQLLTNRPTKLVAIGECGLDYHYNHSTEADQKEILVFQLEMAKKYKLPLIFHVREAFDDFWKIYDRYKLPGLVHSFTAGDQELDAILKRGLLVGVNGIITFTREQAQLESAKNIPLDKLVLETDAPYLTPKPYRGKICRPKHIVEVARFLSELRGEDLEQIASKTTNNAKELFKLQ